jgi:uncharacterized protein (TIGR03790 family)
MRVPFALAVLSFCLLARPSIGQAQSADNLLLVINADSPASVEVGEYYAKVRHVAADHIVRLHTPAAETISRPDFEQTIVFPISTTLARQSLQDRILYIVLTKGVPIRIAGTGGREGTASSVDSELCLLYMRFLGANLPVLGWVPNPYYLGSRPQAEAKRSTRFTSELYLVTRLDGFTVEDVLALIDRAARAVPQGKVVLDEKATLLDRGGDEWLQEAANRLKQTGVADQVVLDTTRDVASTPDPVIGYYSWGSNDPAHVQRQSGLKFSPGAIGAMFVSTDARTFTEPPATWKPSGPNGGPNFGGSFQSLAGDLIRDGLTGVAGHVNEPYLDATIRPQILFPAYVSGFNLAEAFYLAMPYLSWQTVVIGDPLCAPFSKTPLAPSELDKGLDPETGLPALFVERRLAIADRAGLKAAGVKVMLRLEGEVGRGDTSNLETLLVRATELEPRLLVAQTQLAELYANRQEWDKAIDRYRRIVAVDDKNQFAMNNLAYYLAEYGHAPGEALPIAQRAYRLAPAPEFADTVGWIHHLLGEDNAAVPFINQAVAQRPGNVDVLIHAATIHSAVHENARARTELDAAEKLGLSDSQKAAVLALRQALERPRP